jgi:two-component system LytT family sensor kinase
MSGFNTFPAYLALSARAGGTPRIWLGSPVYWACQIVGWGIYAANDLNNARRDSHLSVGAELSQTAWFLAVCLLVSHLLRVAILRERRLGPCGFLGWIPLAVHVVGAAFVLTIGLASIAAWLTPAALEEILLADPAEFGDPIAVFTTLHTVLLGVWVGLYFTAQFIRFHRHVELDRWTLALAAQSAELKALRSQLNPHFLFNALNTIRGLTPTTATEARAAVSQLSSLLRATLGLNRNETVALSEEFAMVSHYLALEGIRHGQRLRAEIAVPPAAAACAVPPFLVQTLVENAVKYGVEARETGSDITVSAELPSAETLCIRVTNTGRLAPARDSAGTGLALARQRLALLFGPAATLTLRADSDDFVTAEVILPARPVPPA